MVKFDIISAHYMQKRILSSSLDKCFASRYVLLEWMILTVFFSAQLGAQLFLRCLLPSQPCMLQLNSSRMAILRNGNFMNFQQPFNRYYIRNKQICSVLTFDEN
jgi:hypothetical protein